jgi:hypothetical protein
VGPQRLASVQRANTIILPQWFGSVRDMANSNNGIATQGSSSVSQ